MLSTTVRSRVVGAAGWILALLVTAAIGVARVYRGMHHPTDVLLGAVMGVCCLIVARTALRGPTEPARPAPTRPPTDGTE